MADTTSIKLDREQYIAMLEALSLARWVSSNRPADVPPSPMEEKVRKLEEHVIQRADDVGCGDLVEFDHALGGYFPTRQFEDRSDARKAIERYEEEFFWSELVRVLSKRDLDRSSPGEYEELAKHPDGPDRPRHPVEERYWDEFIKNGPNNLMVFRPQPHE